MIILENLDKYALTTSLDDNIKMIQEIFYDDTSLNLRKFQNQYNGLKGCLLFVEDMVDTTVINEYILRPILESKVLLDDRDYIEYLSSHIIISSTLNKSTSMEDIVDSIVSGDTIITLEGYSQGIIVSSKGWKTRAIEEPNSEKVLRGPKEGFTECLSTNISMLRRKIRTKDLRFQIGRASCRERV